MIARIAYGALFVLLLPLALAAWAGRLDQLLPLPLPPIGFAGPWLLAAGFALMIAGTMALWRHGRGLPMSAFPPERLVTRGAYRLLANPLYVGAVLVAFGAAVSRASAAAIWIVAPTLAALATAWVMGFEASHTTALFGQSARPSLHLPDPADRPPTPWERAAVIVRVLVPWLILFQAVEWLGIPRHATAVPRLPGERDWPVIAWMEAFYILTYPLVISAPFLARRARDLRRFAVDGLVATALIIPLYLLVPLIVEAKPVPSGSWWSPLLAWERVGDAPVTAFPSFHVVWVLIATDVLRARWPRATPGWTILALAVSVSCVTTGMHAVLDVAAGVVAYAVVRKASPIWRVLCRATEGVANSWREWRLGPVRVLSHGAYAALGGAGGAMLATMLAGTGEFRWIVMTTVVAIVGASLWAQLVEGSSQLLRPYGYFGSVVGVLLVCLVAVVTGHDGWLLLAAMSAGGCVTVVFGRMRCLVQGCCHGHATAHTWGIRYTHPRSRVVRLSALGGVPVHPTPLYSALWAIASGAVLVRLWTLAAPVTFIAGVAFMLAGLGRFVEEHFRGEPQTAQVAGLRLYQWLAIAMVVVGAMVTCVRSGPAPTPQLLDGGMGPVLAALFVFVYVAYGVDFPDSNARYSRLV